MQMMQLADMLTQMSDQQLMQEAQHPSGAVPQFMVISELQRRKQLRAQPNAPAGGPPKTTVMQDIMGGIAATPQMSGASAPVDAGGVAGYAGGGPVGYRKGSLVTDDSEGRRAADQSSLLSSEIPAPQATGVTPISAYLTNTKAAEYAQWLKRHLNLGNIGSSYTPPAPNITTTGNQSFPDTFNANSNPQDAKLATAQMGSQAPFDQLNFDNPAGAPMKTGMPARKPVQASYMPTAASYGLPDNGVSGSDGFMGGNKDAVVNAVMGSVFQQESGNNDRVKNSVDGAVGPGQVMPATFKRFAMPGESITNPRDNRAVAQRYMSYLYDVSGGDPQRMMVGYFSGEGNINPDPNGTPWVKDKKDGTGKTVSGYVADNTGRLGVPAFGPGPMGTGSLDAPDTTNLGLGGMRTGDTSGIPATPGDVPLPQRPVLEDPKGIDSFKDQVNSDLPYQDNYGDIISGLQARKGKLADDKKEAVNMALIQAGLGIAAGTSQYALQNIGEGGLAGVQAYGKAKQELNAREDNLDQNTAMLQVRRAEAKQAAEQGNYKLAAELMKDYNQSIYQKNREVNETYRSDVRNVGDQNRALMQERGANTRFQGQMTLEQAKEGAASKRQTEQIQATKQIHYGDAQAAANLNNARLEAANKMPSSDVQLMNHLYPTDENGNLMQEVSDARVKQFQTLHGMKMDNPAVDERQLRAAYAKYAASPTSALSGNILPYEAWVAQNYPSVAAQLNIQPLAGGAGAKRSFNLARDGAISGGQ